MVLDTDTVSSSAVVDALVQQIKNKRSHYVFATKQTMEAGRELAHYSEEKAASLEQWHQIVNFLDLHFPGWEVNLDEEQRKGIRPL